MTTKTPSTSETYVTALKFHWLGRFYDVFFAATMPEKQILGHFVERLAHIRNEKILDVGCGTGALAIRLSKEFPHSQISAIDVDPIMLEQAKRKLDTARPQILFQRADVTALPFENEKFDAVVSSMTFHHLSTEAKTTALREIFRILRPGGRLLIIDFGKPVGWVSFIVTHSIHLLDGVENTRVNRQGKLPLYIQDAGFSEVKSAFFRNCPFGSLHFYGGTRE